MIVRIREKLFGGASSKVMRGMATLAAGAFASKLIGFITVPILTRVYSPADYGVLSIFMSVVLILAPFMTLRYTLAMPLPKGDGAAINLLALSVSLIILFGTILCLVLWVISEALFAFLSIEVLEPWWGLVIVGAAGVALYESITMWITRKRLYKKLAKVSLYQTLIGEAIKLTLGFWGVKPLGLLIGQLMTLAGGAAILLSALVVFFKEQRKKVSWHRMRFVAKYFSEYPIYRLPSQFLVVTSTHAPLVITAAFFDSEVTGQLGLALMFISVPVSLLGETMSKAYYAEIALLGRRQSSKIKRVTYAVMGRLALIALFPAVGVYLLGEQAFTIMFGANWALAGEIASILSISLLFQFIQKPVSYLMFIFDGQKDLLFLNLQRAALIVLCFIIGGSFGFDIIHIILGYSLVISLHYAVSVVVALKKIPSEA